MKAKNPRPRGATSTLPEPPANDAPQIDHALFHAGNGEASGAFGITPLRPGTKRAYLDNWSSNPFTTRAVVERHWRKHPNDNIGLVPLPGYFWLDADDLDVLEALEAKHGRLPRTYTQRSVSGNLQFLLKGNVTACNQIHFDGAKLGEFRGALSGQCVGAGSRGTAKNGKPGRWTIEEYAMPAEAPQWVLDMAGKGARASAKDRRADYGEVTDWDTEQARRLVELVERGERIKEYDGAFVEGERDNLTFRLFAEGKGRMVHPHAMLEAVLGSGIAGGLEEDVVERKMDSAYFDGNTQDGYGAKVDAYIDANFTFKPRVNGEPVDRAPADPVQWKAANSNSLPKRFPGDPQPARARLMTTASARPFYYLDEMDSISEPTYLADGVVPEGGACLCYGKRSTKKSFIALDLGLCIATGHPWHGRKVKHGRVVMFAGEGFRGQKRRVKAWFQARGLRQEDYSKWFALVRLEHKLDTAPGRDAVARILNEIAKDGPIALVIIDTARRAMSGDENAPTQVGQFLDGVSEICKPFNCAYLLIHHAGKDDSKGARGGGPFEDDTDAVFRITRSGDGLVVMTCTKQKDDEANWALKFRADKIALGTDGDGKPIASLSLTLHSETQASDDDAEDREQKAEAAFVDRTAQAVVSKAVRDFLRSNKLQPWSERNLAKSLAADKEMEISESALRKTWLPRIRSSKTDPARFCFDRMNASGRWIYSKAADNE